MIHNIDVCDAAMPSAALYFADPPFNIGYTYNTHDDNLKPDEYVHWCRKWMERIPRLTHASFFLMIGDEYVSELDYVAKRLGWQRRNWIIWHYGFGVHCVNQFNRSHTHILYYVGSKLAPFCSPTVPSLREAIYADKRARVGGKTPDADWALRIADAPSSESWNISRVCGTFKERVGWHPCQMPEEIAKRIILTASSPGDVVVDLFAGSGTFCKVAKETGRAWVGYEKDPLYAEKAQERING